MLQTGAIRALALVLFVFLVSLPEITSEHQWLPLTSAGHQPGHHSRWSARQLLYSVRMRARGGKGVQTAIAGLERSAWESRLPIFVIGLKHREEERLAKFLLKLRWFEDLHVVEAVDGRTLEPTDRMTSGEVLSLHALLATLTNCTGRTFDSQSAPVPSVFRSFPNTGALILCVQGLRLPGVGMCADWLF